MIQVIKRNGNKEELELDKVHKVLEWACEGITGVSVSEIELKSQIQFYNGIKTSDIHETMIKSAAGLITEDTPNYQFVAGRLINYGVRKDVYGSHIPDNLLDHYTRIEEMGFYDSEIADAYTLSEWDELDSYINHNRDNDLTYAAMEQLRGKYLVKNRVTSEIFETPQIAFMLIAMKLFSEYKEDRMMWVKRLYDALSTFDISLPTPIMAGVRTPRKQFSSCVLIESADDLDSIIATNGAIMKYVADKAGIGIGAGAIRSVGSPIRNGDAYSTGVIPFYKGFQASVNSCNQGGIRQGSGTLHCMWWHSEIEDILVLKNNKGTEENRIRNLDYSIQFNKMFYERVLADETVTLFSPSEVPGLYDAFFADQEKFTELYLKYEKMHKVLGKKTIKARDLFASFIQERKDTGRMYLMNVDHANDHGSFYDPIKMSNLCQEITLPTRRLYNVDDEDGRIALCILAAVNWGKITKPEDFALPAELCVRALDALIDLQRYILPAAKHNTMEYRPIGVGIINFAYWLAKNGENYSECNLDVIHEYAEAWSYYLIKASADLAVEKGPCLLNDKTKYSDGILPIDTYKQNVDELTLPVYNMPWEDLRKQLIETGIRNATLMALMPSESSSILSNSTNGIEPPRSLVTIKQSKDGVLPQVVPSIFKLKNKYELLWDQKRPDGYLKIMAVLQKFIDQSISTNTSYNPAHYPDSKIPMSAMMGDILTAYKYGIKTLYYNNTLDQAGEIDTEEDCDSCAI